MGWLDKLRGRSTAVQVLPASSKDDAISRFERQEALLFGDAQPTPQPPPPYDIGELNRMRLQIEVLKLAVRALHIEHPESNKVRKRLLDKFDAIEQGYLDEGQQVGFIREARKIARDLLPEYPGHP